LLLRTEDVLEKRVGLEDEGLALTKTSRLLAAVECVDGVISGDNVDDDEDEEENEDSVDDARDAT
jgi:hypothetical protein